MTQRVLCYLRQSDTSGAGRDSLSLASQQAELERAIALRGWRVVGVVTDADERGWDDTRPGLAELYARCRNREVDIVAVWSLSRLARSLRIQETVVHDLAQFGVEIWSHQEPWVGQPLFRQILGALAEQQTRDLSAHVRRALHAKAERGIHHGRVPWGYLRPDKDARLTIDPEPAAIVRGMFEARARGQGPAAIARDLAGRGIHTVDGGIWSASQVVRTLSHVAYRGAVLAGDGTIEDAHPAIVDAALWQAAQQRAQPGRRTYRQKSASSWLEGLVEHRCGNPMYLIGPYRTKDFSEFRCRAAGAGMLNARQEACPYLPRTMRQGRLERLAWHATMDALDAILSPTRVLAAAKRRYRALAPGNQEARKQALERKSRAVAQRSRAEALYLDGTRDRAWFDAQDAQTAADIAAADMILLTLPAPPEVGLIEADWRALRELRDVAASVPETERRQVVRALGVVVVAPMADGGALVTIRVHTALRQFWPDSDI